MAVNIANLKKDEGNGQQQAVGRSIGIPQATRGFDVPAGHQQLMNQIIGMTQPGASSSGRFIGSSAPPARSFGLPTIQRPTTLGGQNLRFGGGGGGGSNFRGGGGFNRGTGGYFGGSQVNPILEFLKWLSQGGFTQ